MYAPQRIDRATAPDAHDPPWHPPLALATSTLAITAAVPARVRARRGMSFCIVYGRRRPPRVGSRRTGDDDSRGWGGSRVRMLATLRPWRAPMRTLRLRTG